MFTGLVETTAVIKGKKSGGGGVKLSLLPDSPLESPEFGESVAVNGACLTLEGESGGVLTFHVLDETMRRTNLGSLGAGARVNIERAMGAKDRFGGHIVTGHVDAVAEVLEVGRSGKDLVLCVGLHECVAPFLAEKGCVCVDGVSLTPVRVEKDRFTVHIIPVTWGHTALRERAVGSLVNLEADIIARYVRRQLGMFSGRSGRSAWMI